jgi:hypothetical protein
MYAFGKILDSRIDYMHQKYVVLITNMLHDDLMEAQGYQRLAC